MSAFDRNRWYDIRIYDTSLSLYGDPYTSFEDDPNKDGLVILRKLEDQIEPGPGTRWQILEYNSSFYMLRSQNSLGKAWLRVGKYLQFNSSRVDAPNMRIFPDMKLDKEHLESMLWRINPLSEQDGIVGGVNFSNAANGTDCLMIPYASPHLVIMTKDPGVPLPQLRFIFNETGTIDDPAFSSGLPALSLPTATITAPSTASTVNSLPTQSQSEIPKGTKIGIGVSAGAMLIFTMGVMFYQLFFRMRGDKNSIESKGELLEFSGAREFHGEHLRDLEAPQHLAELGTGSRHFPAELPGDEIRFIPAITT